MATKRNTAEDATKNADGTQTGRPRKVRAHRVHRGVKEAF
jgi:hypothetical protein